MLKAIFFDAAGTLIYLPRTVGEHYREVATRFGVELDAAQLDRAFRVAWTKAPARVSTRRPRVEDDKHWWRELVENVLAQVLSSEERAVFDADGYFEAVYAHFAQAGVWAVFPEVSAVLTELHARGVTLGVISNFDRRLHAVFDHLRLTAFFEHIIVSSEVGADKPDPYIFEHALTALRVTPEEAIHVGDDPKCDGGAGAVGLRVFQLERPAGSLRGVLEMIDRESVA